MKLRPQMQLRFRSEEHYERVKRAAEIGSVSVNEYVLLLIDADLGKGKKVEGVAGVKPGGYVGVRTEKAKDLPVAVGVKASSLEGWSPVAGSVVDGWIVETGKAEKCDQCGKVAVDVINQGTRVRKRRCVGIPIHTLPIPEKKPESKGGMFLQGA